MRWRGLLEPAFYPRSKWPRATYTTDDLYLCTCHFAIWFAHRRQDILEITSRLVIGIIPTHTNPCPALSFLSLYPCSAYERHENLPDNYHSPHATAGELPTKLPRTVLHSLLALASPTTLKVHSLDCLRVRSIVFQRSMASSLTPVQTSHLQTLMLNDPLQAPVHHSLPLLIMVVQAICPHPANSNGVDSPTAPQSPSDRTSDHWFTLTIPVPALPLLPDPAGAT
jgi:hypothetical protein